MYGGVLVETPDDSTLIEGNAILPYLSLSNIIPANNLAVTLADVYLMEQLALTPASGYGDDISNHTLYLHDIENALSSLVASIFWIGSPVLATGQTWIQQVEPAVRLDISLLAVSLGLASSIALLVISITPFTAAGYSTTALDKMGLLQAMWVFHHHPDLSEILEQVEDPTDHNLRVAGLIESVVVSGEIWGKFSHGVVQIEELKERTTVGDWATIAVVMAQIRQPSLKSGGPCGMLSI
ncbi:hypothetical protein B0H13DRAFT_1886843 [Mycena leptocephala]|nr:hypothetical protein B0H13DRAFT_1886843 [Mycena leptocephala]